MKKRVTWDWERHGWRDHLGLIWRWWARDSKWTQGFDDITAKMWGLE